VWAICDLLPPRRDCNINQPCSLALNARCSMYWNAETKRGFPAFVELSMPSNCFVHRTTSKKRGGVSPLSLLSTLTVVIFSTFGHDAMPSPTKLVDVVVRSTNANAQFSRQLLWSMSPLSKKHLATLFRLIQIANVRRTLLGAIHSLQRLDCWLILPVGLHLALRHGDD